MIFSSELGNFFAAAKTEPIVPGFAQTIARREIPLVEFITLEDLGENSADRKIVGIQNRVGGADGGGVVRVAGGNHGKTPDLRIFKRVTVVAAQCRGGVKNFDRINRQRFQNGKANSGAKKIVGMWWNREPAALMNDVANFARRFSFQEG